MTPGFKMASTQIPETKMAATTLYAYCEVLNIRRLEQDLKRGKEY